MAVMTVLRAKVARSASSEWKLCTGNRSGVRRVVWRARAGCPIGRPSLITALNDDFLEAARRAGATENMPGLAYNLVQVSRWAIDQPSTVSAALLPKIRAALATASPKVRERTAWVFWVRMAGEKGETFDHAERWRSEVGPAFDRIWPLDANARDPDVSRNLVMMALESGEAFPDVVEVIRDVVVPYDVVTIAGWLQGQPAHQEATTGHPRAFLRLLNAVLSADMGAIPPDLGPVLDECLAADPSVRSDPAFARLDALRRRSASYPVRGPGGASRPIRFLRRLPSRDRRSTPHLRPQIGPVLLA
jgi:hypothetical protein